MPTVRTESLELRSSSDVVVVRQAVRTWAVEAGFSLIDQTKIVTAASELARNTVDYGGGGVARLELLTEGTRRGLRVAFEDRVRAFRISRRHSPTTIPPAADSGLDSEGRAGS